MSYIDIQYVNRISSRLLRYSLKSINPLVANFRCPFCGDSGKNSTMARGYILTFPNTSDHYYYCHNCQMDPKPFAKFLQDFDGSLYKEYIVELFKTNNSGRKRVKEEDAIPAPARVPVAKIDPLAGLKSIAELDEYHPARRYIETRCLPEERLSQIFFVSKFKEFVNRFLPDKFDLKRDEGRIVVPLTDEDGRVFGVVGRAIDPKSLRYLTILFDDTKAKIFGMDKVDKSKQVFILEGAFDSMFVENSIAMAGVTIRNNGIETLTDRVFVLDNQPRNKDVVRIMGGLIDAGEKVVMWPDMIKAKDVNQMILDGELKQSEIVNFLRAHTAQGLTAKLKLTKWKKTQ